MRSLVPNTITGFAENHHTFSQLFGKVYANQMTSPKL